MEIWKPALDYPKYEVSNLGRCRKATTKRVLVGGKSLGYHHWTLQRAGEKQRTVRAHRLVWQSFNRRLVGDEQINHLNGVRSDNWLANLEACTPSENIQHSYDNLGRRSRTEGNLGTVNGRAKLTESDALAIMCLVGDYPQREIADAYGVSQAGVWHIAECRTWQHLLQ